MGVKNKAKDFFKNAKKNVTSKLKSVAKTVEKQVKKTVHKYTPRNIKSQYSNVLAPDVKMYQDFSQYAYNPNNDEVNQKLLDGNTGYQLDPTLSSNEHKVFIHPGDKRVVVAYRGTALGDKKTRLKDLVSDAAIAFGMEKHDKRFKQANVHFQQASDKYKDYTIDTTGHSLGGQLSKHVNDRNKGRVEKNIAFSRGTGLLEPFRKKERNTLDVSNVYDPISIGARLQGGRHVIETRSKSGLGAHSLKDLYK
jgi:hypothetical protein